MTTAGGASSLDGGGGGGGGGGKMRRRASRRTGTTPYDRPLPAPPNPSASNGWLSKLVDPASRLITVGASRIFHSVFGRRPPPDLAAPPPSDVNRQSAKDFAEPITIKSSSGVGEMGNCADSKPENDRISKVEQLLKQKTLTREEFDRLNGILRSRTLDVFADEVNTKISFEEKKRFEATTSQPVATHEVKEEVMLAKNGVENSALFGSVSAGTKVPEDEAASPSELAKAYMGTRPLRISPTTLGWRNQALRGDSPMFNNLQLTPKSSSKALALKSGHISDNGYLTPRTQGRSAIYNMARSPYARFPSPATSKSLHAQNDGCAGLSTSLQRTHVKNLQLSNRQVLKRQSLALDNNNNNSGYGAIRRVRQKSNLTISSKDMDSSVYGKALPIPLTPVRSDAGKSLPLDDVQIKENGKCRISTPTSYSSVPPQSSETARKIFLHLEQMASSPKAKSSEMKLAIARREPPSTLTSNMLNERALKSMEEIEMPKLENVPSNDGSLDVPVSGFNLLGPGLSSPQNNKKAEENGVLEIGRVSKSSYEVNGFANSVHVPIDTASGSKMGNSKITNSAASQLHNKRGFQMTAPEDYLELDDDDDQNSEILSAPLGTEKVTQKNAAVAFADVVVENKIFTLTSDSKKRDYKFHNGADVAKKVLDPPIIAEKEVGFTISATSTATFSAPAFAPIGQTSLFNKADMQKEKSNDNPIFGFSGKSIDQGTTLSFSSSANNVSSTSELKFGAGFDSKPELVSGNAVSSDRHSESITFDEELKNKKEVESFRPPENFEPLSSSIISARANLNYGAPAPSTSAFSVSSTTTDFAFGNGSTTVASSSISLSSSATPAISSSEFINIGSASAPSSNALSAHAGTGPSDVEIKTKLASPFSSSLPTSTTAVSNTKNLFGSGASTHSDGTGSSLSAGNQGQYSSAPFAASTGSLFGNGGATTFTQSTGSQSVVASALSPTSGLSNSSLSDSAMTLFQTFASAPSFSSAGSASYAFGGSGSQLASSTSIGLSSSSSQPISTGVTTSLFAFSSQSANSTSASTFGFSSQPIGTSSVFSSNSQSAASSNLFGSNPLPATSITTFGSSSQPATSTSLFGSQPATSSSLFSSQPTVSSIFGTVPSTSSSTGFSFVSPSIGASSGSSMFFTSSATAPPSVSFPMPSPAFSMPNQPVSFGSPAPSNDQMNVEDSMAEDTLQPTNVPSSPLFGQVANASSSTPQPFVFGSPAVPSGGTSVFQFGGHPPQAPSLFSPAGGAPAGSFSLGTTGGSDKSGRRIVKIRRDKARKK